MHEKKMHTYKHHCSTKTEMRYFTYCGTSFLWDLLRLFKSMSKFIRFIFLFSWVVLSGCAGSVQSAVRVPLSVELEVEQGFDAAVWQKAAAEVSVHIPEYEIRLKDAGRDKAVFHTIQWDEDRAHMCLAPRVKVDHAGHLTDVVPMYCTHLDGQNAVQALTDALDAAQAQTIQVPRDNSAAFRAQILSESTSEHPICYSVYPALFAADEYDLSPALEEAYLIACADRIESVDADTWQKQLSQRLAGWLRVEAALLSTQSQFIARAFRKIAEDGTKEGMIYGQAIEAYTEFLARKTRQTEITALNALKQSDDAGMLMLSRQTAMRLSYVVALADTMDGSRIEHIVKTLAPRSSWPSKIIEYRKWLQIKICQTSVIIPDISSSLVSACMPWLEASVTDIDEFEMVLLLIEHGMYGTKDEMPVMTDDVFEWLEHAAQAETLKPAIREFVLRIQTHERLTDAQRDRLKSMLE